jgi:hypothetical protein
MTADLRGVSHKLKEEEEEAVVVVKVGLIPFTKPCLHNKRSNN